MKHLIVLMCLVAWNYLQAHLTHSSIEVANNESWAQIVAVAALWVLSNFDQKTVENDQKTTKTGQN